MTYSISFSLLPSTFSLPCTFFELFYASLSRSSGLLSRRRIKRERLSFAADTPTSESTHCRAKNFVVVLLVHYEILGLLRLIDTKESEL